VKVEGLNYFADTPFVWRSDSFAGSRQHGDAPAVT